MMLSSNTAVYISHFIKAVHVSDQGIAGEAGLVRFVFKVIASKMFPGKRDNMHFRMFFLKTSLQHSGHAPTVDRTSDTYMVINSSSSTASE